MNLLGKLNWSAIPFDQPIVMGASGGMILGIVAVAGWVTLKGYVPYLWNEWLTSVDHKRIGVMYIVLALLMLLRGKQSAGVTPHYYLIQKRIERAQQILAQTDLSLAEIAYTVGFSDKGHLARHFRALLGTTPREFRRSQR